MLLYLDDFMFMEREFRQCVRLARRVEKDLFLAGLTINVPMCHMIPTQQRRQLGFDVDFVACEFRVPEDRWEALMASIGGLEAIRPQGRSGGSLIGKHHGDGVVNAPLLGSGDPALHEASVCPDKFRVDATQLWVGVDGGSD